MKRTAASLLVSFGFVGAVLGLAFVLRLPLAETAIRTWLSGRGLEESELTVVALGRDRLEIADIRAGEVGAVQIHKIVIDYSMDSLARLRAKNIEIVEPHLRAEIYNGVLRVDGIPLHAVGSAANGKSFNLPADTIRLRGAVVEVTTPYGPFKIWATGNLDAPEDGPLAGRMTFNARGDQGGLGMVLSLSGQSFGDLDGRFDVTEGHFRIPGADIRTLHGKGTFYAKSGMLETAALSLSIQDAFLPGMLPDLSGAFEIDASYRQGRGALRANFTEAVGGQGLGMEVDASNIIVDGTDATADIVLNARLDRFQSELVAARGLSAAIPIKVVARDRRIEIVLSGDGRLHAADINAKDLLRASGPLDLTLLPGPSPVATVELDGNGTPVTVTHAISASLGNTGFIVASPGGPGHAITASEARLDFGGRLMLPATYHGKGTATFNAITLSGFDIALRRVGADFTLGSGPPGAAIRLVVGDFADTRTPLRFNPLELTVNAQADEHGHTAFSANLNDAAGIPRATVKGHWPLTGPREAIVIEIPAIDFVRGGLQPAAFFPALAGFDVSKGRISGSARIDRDSSGALKTSAALIADALAFDLPGTSVSGLSANIRLDSLLPLSTPPNQLLTVDRIELLTPLDDVRALYRLVSDADGQPRLDLANLRANLLGGTVSLENVALQTGTRPISLPLAVSGIDLPRLFDLIGVDGLRGTGMLSGRLPVIVAGSTIAVKGGRLAADSGGILNLESKTAADFLAAQGESVDLALRALQNFHYSEMSVEIDREAGGDARAVLRLLGYNPAVLDGHPFRFNVTLDSNIDQLLATLLQGYRTATDSLQRATGPHR